MLFFHPRDKKHFDIGIVTLGEKDQPKRYDYILKGKAIDANGSPLDSIAIIAENSKSGKRFQDSYQ